MFRKNYAFVFIGKEIYVGFNHLDPWGYKYLSSLKKIEIKLLLIRIKKLLLVSNWYRFLYVNAKFYYSYCDTYIYIMYFGSCLKCIYVMFWIARRIHET